MTNRTRRGSALIIALWTIALLSLLVMSFASDAMIEGKIGTYVRQRRHNSYLTQSGVAITEMLLLKMGSVSSASSHDTEEDRWREPALRLKRGQAATIEEHIEDGVIRVEIVPEEARWNINLLCASATANGATAKASAQGGSDSLSPYDEVWERILTEANVPEDRWEELIDSWNDWTDTDSTPTGQNGAEDEYYTSLDTPYKTRNGPIDNIDELRLVKGFSDVILDGGCLNPEEKNPNLRITVKGIKELFTTYGNGKINVNAAPMEVLMTIPGMDEITAGATIEEREGVGYDSTGSKTRTGTSSTSTTKGKSSTSTSSRTTTKSSSGSSGKSSDSDAEEEEDYSFKTVADFTSRVQIKDTSIQQYVTTQSTTFRVKIIGKSAGISHAISAVVMVDNDTIKYLRWREDP